MKITCTKCGKRFNGEENLYICPKCNHYHSQVRTRSKMTEKEKVLDIIDDLITEDIPDGETEFIQTVNSEQTIYAARKKTEERSGIDIGNLDLTKIIKKIWIGICIVGGCIIFIAGPFASMLNIGAWSDDPASWDNGWGSSYTEEMVVEYGDPMDFETFTVNIEEVSEPEFGGIKEDDGYKLVRVDFTTESPYGYEDGDIWTEASLAYTYEDDSEYFEYYALYEDEVTNDNTFEKQLVEDGLVTEAHYSGSYFFIFEIPKEADNLVLKIYTYVPEEGETGSYVEAEHFQMPLEL